MQRRDCSDRRDGHSLGRSNVASLLLQGGVESAMSEWLVGASHLREPIGGSGAVGLTGCGCSRDWQAQVRLASAVPQQQLLARLHDDFGASELVGEQGAADALMPFASSAKSTARDSHRRYSKNQCIADTQYHLPDILCC